VCLALPRNSFGQSTTATILGAVKDQSGAVVASATVTAKSLETGLTRAATTDQEGRYRIGELAPGSYEVQAERQGFSTQVHNNITLFIGREAALDFSLAVGNVNERVVVTSQAALVETTSPTLSGLVNNRTIQELPLNGRDVFQLTTLQTGVISTAAITGGAGLGGNATLVGPGSTKISVNGQRITANSFLLDGTSINDAFNNTPGGLSGSFLGVDAFQEFQVVTNSYGAEYGQAGGAVINAVTKSGTNSLHGSAFEFHRNSAFDAPNFFDPNSQPPPFKRNQFGGSLGGPIIKNRTFIFGSYEGLRQDLGASKRYVVPTAAARARAIPSVKPYIDLYPQPNDQVLGPDTAFYLRPAKDITNEDSFVIRADHQFAESNSFSARYTFDESDLRVAIGPIQDSLTAGRNQYAHLSDTHVFSQRLINVARFGYNRSFIFGTEPFIVDIPSSLSFIPGHPLGGFFNFVDVSPIANSLQVPRRFVYNSFEFNDAMTWTSGEHTVKFGGLVRRIQFNSLQGRAADGVYIFGTLNNFLAGRAQAFVAPKPGSNFYRGIRETVMTLYGQDDWKVRPNLTLNLGLRYEFFTTPTEANGLIANLRNPTDLATTVGEPFFENPSYRNFAPRLGFAWQPFGNNRTSVRGGFGIFDVVLLPYNYRSEITLQPPFSVTSFVFGPPFPNGYDRINSPAPQLTDFNSFGFNPDRTYVMQYNLSVQRDLGFDTVVNVAYVGVRGVHLVRRNNVNLRTDFQIVNGQKFYPQIPGNQVQARRLNPTIGENRRVMTDANSLYHGLQVNLNKRLSRDFEFTVAYTWAKAIDDVPDYTGALANSSPGSSAQDTYNPGGDRGRSGFDIRHSFTSSWVYSLPFGRSLQGAAAKFADGWQLNGIITARTGFPFSPFIGFDRAQDGTSNSAIGQRASLAPGRKYEDAVTGNPSRWIDPSVFVLQPAGFYGTAGRNVLTGPGFFTFDFGITKNTNITEAVRVQFRAEVFNLTNRANFALPDNQVIFSGANAQGQGVVPESTGIITRTVSTARQWQLGLKFIF
jgi:outer membrane receptor protein involved in Fe transport